MKVRLHTTLQRRTPGGMVRHLEVQLPESSTLADLLKVLEIRQDLKGVLLVLNGRTAQPAQALAEGDEVHLIPALSGG